MTNQVHSTVLNSSATGPKTAVSQGQRRHRSVERNDVRGEMSEERLKTADCFDEEKTWWLWILFSCYLVLYCVAVVCVVVMK